jgi:hypothetical protein
MLSSSSAAAGDAGDTAGDWSWRLSWLCLGVGSSGRGRASSTSGLEWLDPEDTERPRLDSCGADNLAGVETVLGSVLCCESGDIGSFVVGRRAVLDSRVGG